MARRRVASLRHEPKATFHALHDPTLLGAPCRFAVLGALRGRVIVVTAQVRHRAFFAHLEFGDRLARHLKATHGASERFETLGLFGTRECWRGDFGDCVALCGLQTWTLTYRA